MSAKAPKTYTARKPVTIAGRVVKPGEPIPAVSGFIQPSRPPRQAVPTDFDDLVARGLACPPEGCPDCDCGRGSAA